MNHLMETLRAEYPNLKPVVDAPTLEALDAQAAARKIDVQVLIDEEKKREYSSITIDGKRIFAVINPAIRAYQSREGLPLSYRTPRFLKAVTASRGVRTPTKKGEESPWEL